MYSCSNGIPTYFCKCRIQGSVLHVLCNMCKNDVEDEKHFLFDCNLYSLNRETFFRDLNIDVNSNRNIILKNLCEKKPRQLGKYLLKTMEIRKSKTN